MKFLTLINLIFILTGILLTAGTAVSQDGQLDPTFGVSGIVTMPTTPMPSFGSLAERGPAVVVQTDGKIVIGGNNLIVRYNTDGSLDPSFDSDGIVNVTNGVTVLSAALQTDGKIVFGGYYDNGSNSDFGLVRYNTDGGIDLTFGINGRVFTSLSTTDEVIYSLAIQTDGKIVAAGYSGHIFPCFAVARYNSDGSLDNTFGSNGKMLVDISQFSIGYSVALQTDGKIVVAGDCFDFDYDFALLRLNTNGSLDNTFGVGGRQRTAIDPGDIFGGDANANDDGGRAVAIDNNGKIYVAGYTYVTNELGSDYSYVVVRYNSNGSVDNSYNGNGKVVINLPGEGVALGMALQPDGKLVISGYGSGGSAANLVRLNVTGSIDPTFGNSGISGFAVGGGMNVGFSVAFQPDGKIVLSGYNMFTSHFFVGRFTEFSGSLPVELTSFTATPLNNLVKLKWTTATEVNNYGFEVQRRSQEPSASGGRSQNKNSQWEKIGFVNGNGNSNSQKTYTYNDQNFSAENYLYRLKQIDVDGSYKYSETVEASFAPAGREGMKSEFALLQNYPNPFNPETMIGFTVSKNGQASLKIYNILGEEVATLFNELAESGKYYSVKFSAKGGSGGDVSGLATGIYYARLESGNNLMVKKMLYLK